MVNAIGQRRFWQLEDTMRKADRVTLVKKDGREFPDIRADVQPKMIFIDDPKLSVEEGDHFTRNDTSATPMSDLFRGGIP